MIAQIALDGISATVDLSKVHTPYLKVVREETKFPFTSQPHQNAQPSSIDFTSNEHYDHQNLILSIISSRHGPVHINLCPLYLFPITLS